MAENPFEKFAQAPIQRPDAVQRPGEGGISVEIVGRRRKPEPGANPFARFAPTEVTDLVPDESGAKFAAPQIAPQPETDQTRIAWDMPEKDVKAAIRVLPEKERAAALKEFAKRKVDVERKDAGKMQPVYDVGRNLARGTPVGSWLDEGMAWGTTSNPSDYEEELAIQRARNDAADSNATTVGKLPLIGDVTTSGLTKLAGGIISAPVAPTLRVLQGASMLPRIVNAMMTGGIYGAGYGAGEGTDAESRAKGAAVGGVIGTGAGAAAPVIGQGVGNAISGIRSGFNRAPAALQPYERGAVDRVSRAVGDDGIMQPRPQGLPTGYQSESARLGHEGMLADMGENLRGQAGAIANAPGRGQSVLAKALEGRREGATQRITTALDAALGQPVNVPQTVETLRKQANAKAAPYYQQFYSTPVRVSEDLQTILDAAKATGAYDKARRLMAADRVDTNLPENNGQFIDYIKRAVDDLAGAAERGSNEQRIFGNLARALRAEVDNILSPGNPAQSPWDIARREAGDGIQFEKAAEMGQGAFQKSLTPDQMKFDMQGLNPLQSEAYRVGARDAARTTMGNAGTAFGPNGDTAARRTLQTNFGAEKMRQLASSPDAAANLERRLGAETTFAETEAAVLQNSATARRLAAQKEFPGAADVNTNANSIGNKSLTGVALEGVYRLGNMLTAGALNDRRARIAESAAEMLVARGMKRDTIAKGLNDYIQRNRIRGAQAKAISDFAERLIAGGRPVAISNTAPQI